MVTVNNTLSTIYGPRVGPGIHQRIKVFYRLCAELQRTISSIDIYNLWITCEYEHIEDQEIIYW